MKYPALKELKDKEIRRLTGVKRSTFVKMVGILYNGLKNLDKE